SRLSLERRKRNEGGCLTRCGDATRVAALGAGVGRFERRHAGAKLTVIVAQLPVRFGEPLQPLRPTPRACERSHGNDDGRATEQPVEGQQLEYPAEQNSYLTNGLQQCQPPERIRVPQAMPPKPKTVLIVDDDEGMRDTLTAILKREYRVLRVSTG